jgi:sugar phosphate permease
MVVALLWVVAVSFYLTRNMLTTMHGSIVSAIRMTETEFGLLTSVFLWIYSLVNPVGGVLADRFNRSGVIITSMLAWSVVTWLTGYATSFPQLLALRAVMGVSQACYMPAAGALITDYHRGSTRSLAVGVHITGLVFGSTISSLGGWLAERHDWMYAFRVVGLPSILFGVFVALRLRDAPREDRAAADAGAEGPPVSPTAALRAALRNGSILLLVVIGCLQSAVSWVVIAWMPAYMQERFQLGQGAAGFSATGYLSVTQFFSLLASGVWSDRWSRRDARARLWVPAIGLAIAAPSFWMAERVGALPAIIACLCLWGMAVGFMGSNIMPIVCLASDVRSRATAYGVVNGAGGVVGGLAIYWTGALRDLGIDLRHTLSFAGLCALACAGLFLLIKTEKTAAVPAGAAS